LPPSCESTSTYRLRTFRLDACDLGRPGGGAGGASRDPVGVLGAEPTPPSSEGTKFDRTRIGGFIDEFSIAEDARGGGGPALGGRTAGGGGPALGGLPVATEGEVVCALAGGGGGVAGLTAASDPAFLLTHFLSSAS